MGVLKKKKVKSTSISCLIKKSYTFKEKLDCSKTTKITIAYLYYSLTYTMTSYKKSNNVL